MKVGIIASSLIAILICTASVLAQTVPPPSSGALLICSSSTTGVARAVSFNLNQDKKEDRNPESKPQPKPDEDKAEQPVYRGVVRLRAILRASGKVTDIEVIEVKPDDLPEDVVEEWKRRSIEAVSHIIFKPAMKDGRTASQHIKIEYQFNVYDKKDEQ